MEKKSYQKPQAEQIRIELLQAIAAASPDPNQMGG